MKEILTKHFHIYETNGHLICYFEILLRYREFVLWEFIDHKLNEKITWKI